MSFENTTVYLTLGAKRELRIKRSQLLPLVEQARCVCAARRSLLSLKRLSTSDPTVQAELDEAINESDFTDRVYKALLNVPSEDGTIPITTHCLEKLHDERLGCRVLIAELARRDLSIHKLGS